MNKYRPDWRKSLVWCIFLAAGQCAYAVQSIPEDDAPVAVPVQWPETRHVEEWLAHEMRDEPRASRPGIVPAPPRTPTGRSGQLAAPAIELVALYGVGDTLAADVRIGSRVHAFYPASGTQNTARGRGTGSMTAEAIDGTCLRLRYRTTPRTVCLDLDRSKGEVDAH